MRHGGGTLVCGSETNAGSEQKGFPFGVEFNLKSVIPILLCSPFELRL